MPEKQINMPTIKMKSWLGASERSRVVPNDKWYLDFANRILPIVKQSPLFANEDDRTQVDAAISLTMYYYDAISQSGGWKSFSEFYLNLYGKYLPFYSVTDDYAVDEINKEDIAFVIWTLKAHFAVWSYPYTLFSPLDKDLLALSQAAYDMMDESFEEAPIGEEPTLEIWVMGLDLLEMNMVPLQEVTPETPLKKDVELCLEYSKGKPLSYFATYQELKTFFIDVLKWEDKPSSLLPDLEYKKEFVVYANPKGMLIAHNVAAYFCEKHNPMYDAERAAKDGYKIFCIPEACPFDLIKYGMTKGILPDLEMPFYKGKEILHTYWDFLARYYLCEYYEGQ